jgi:hypothetical protein
MGNTWETGHMSRAEGVIALLALSTLTAGIVSAGAVEPASPAPPAAAPVVETTLVQPLPTATRPAAPKPQPTPRRTPVAATTLGPAPPLTGCPVPKRTTPPRPPKPLPPPAVAEAALPAPVPVRAKATDLSVVRGKGLWATPFGTKPVDVAGLVAQARRPDLKAIWVRTGGSRQGYYGDQFLPALVPAAHASGIRVIAWDFPFLSDPVADARRAQRAFAAGVDAFSPDVETVAEGTRLTPRRLALYLSLVRAYAGTRAVIATVPRPSAARKTYPYAAFRPYADVFAPMVYWSCFEPGSVTRASITKLRGLLPVAPVGQGYDMGGEGGRRGTPSRAETLRFLDAARHAGALGASLWTVEEAGPAQLGALRDYRW